MKLSTRFHQALLCLNLITLHGVHGGSIRGRGDDDRGTVGVEHTIDGPSDRDNFEMSNSEGNVPLFSRGLEGMDILLGDYELQHDNCKDFQSLSLGECKEYAVSQDRELCDSANDGSDECGSTSWGDNRNGRPRGCFVDNAIPEKVFYNHGGQDYSGTHPITEAVCHAETPNHISYVTQQKNCGSVDTDLFSQSLNARECKAYSDSIGQRFHRTRVWGKNGNDRPRGCFLDEGLPGFIFYNTGGIGYDSSKGSRPPGYYTAICLNLDPSKLDIDDDDIDDNDIGGDIGGDIDDDIDDDENEDAEDTEEAMVVCGSRARLDVCGADTSIVPKTSRHPVRCCADVFTPTFVQRPGCDVWATSRINQKCIRSATFESAVTHCSSIGARLCTREEIQANCTRGTGCEIDKELVWVSDSI